jgi:hypothetical protein
MKPTIQHLPSADHSNWEDSISKVDGLPIRDSGELPDTSETALDPCLGVHGSGVTASPAEFDAPRPDRTLCFSATTFVHCALMSQ